MEGSALKPKSLAIIATVLGVGAVVHGSNLAAQSLGGMVPPLTSYTVQKPGTVLVNRVARQAALARLGLLTPRLCQRDLARHELPDEPLESLIGRLGYGGNDKRVTPFDWTIIVSGADTFGTGSMRAFDRFMNTVRVWSRAEAMTKLEDNVAGSNTAVNFGLRRSLVSLIPNWALVRTNRQVKPADRMLVDAWIKHLVTLADTNTGGRNRAHRTVNCPANQDTSNCNNHRYLRDTVNIMWGALAADNNRYRKGIERYLVALRQMRADGSLPLETARGSRALWYQNYAIAMLVTIAETAAQQGHNLYALEIKGRSLHHAIAFLLKGIAQPETVFAYARANRNPGPALDWREQDLRFTEPRGRWHHMAWIEAYMARFPNHANTRHIHQQLPWLDEDRPLISRVAGGNTSCLFAKP
jgi:poly(beta-D-mannuronate) lyase